MNLVSCLREVLLSIVIPCDPEGKHNSLTISVLEFRILDK